MATLLTDRRVLIAAAVSGILVAAVLWPATEPVDLAEVTEGPLVVTVDEEGRTRVRDRFVVAAPVSGRVQRIELEPGDRVAAGAVVARLQAEQPPLLDARNRAEAAAAVESAEGVLGRARAEEQRARAALAHAEQELSRSRALTSAGATTRQELNAREAAVSQSAEAVTAAVFAVRSATADVERVRAHAATPARVGTSVVVRAPVSGVVLKRLRESESVIPAGEPLVEIGDPSRIEIVTDLLSTDAVRVAPGARAIIEDWGGDTALEATVRRVEPSGFTRVSALGVEEQRVNVVLDLMSPPPSAKLGDAYRVEARIVLWERPRVLRVPTSALFRHQSTWAVYVARNGRAQLTTVAIGHQNGQDTEVTAGLSAGDQVIVHPGDRVQDGGRIAQRSPS